MRKILTALVKQQLLGDGSLLTFLAEVEPNLNSHPLTPVSDDPKDFEALTPNHILILRGSPGVPMSTSSKEDKHARRRWRQIQYLVDAFWCRWVSEYLPLLQERQKWVNVGRNLKVGGLVLMQESNVP